MVIADATLKAILEDVWADPSDTSLRRIAADAAEDAGMPDLAACLRWMAEKSKWPVRDEAAIKSGWRNQWTWWWDDQFCPEDPRHCLLPQGDVERHHPAETYYQTAREAEENLYLWFARAAELWPEKFA